MFKRMSSVLSTLAIGALCLAAAVVLAGQLGLLKGTAPAHLGVRDGRLAPPSPTPNSVSSQAGLYPAHPQSAYAAVEAFTPRPGESGTQAFQRLTGLLTQQTGTEVVTAANGYVHAEATTRWLQFVDDVELWLDPASDRIEVRSASRLGRKDFGVNRARVERLRQAFDADLAHR